MPPLSVLISDGDPSDAFHDQFSTIIRLESRLRGDHSEDVTGPAHQRWVVKHLTEVAQAQGFPMQLPTQATAFNVHAGEFITPPPAQTTIFGHSGYTTPWHENFNLADQGVFDSSGPYYPAAQNIAFHRLSRPPSPYHPFDPAERAAYRAIVRAQLLQSCGQRAESQPHASSECFDHTSDAFIRSSDNLPRFEPPTTPPNNFSGVRSPFTPPNQSPRLRGQTAPPESPESLSDLVANTTIRASTEPIAESRMGSLTAPDCYKSIEVYAIDVQTGDYIQSVKNPGEVMDHYPCEDLDHEPIGENEARPVSPNGGLRIRFKGADGSTRTKVFKGLDKVRVLRQVAKDHDDGEKEVKKEESQ